MDEPKWLKKTAERIATLARPPYATPCVPAELLLVYVRELRAALGEAQAGSIPGAGVARLEQDRQAWLARQRVLEREEPPEVK